MKIENVAFPGKRRVGELSWHWVVILSWRRTGAGLPGDQGPLGLSKIICAETQETVVQGVVGLGDNNLVSRRFTGAKRQGGSLRDG